MSHQLDGIDDKPLPRAVHRKMVLWYDGRFGHPQFSFAMYDQIQRHAICAGVSLRFKSKQAEAEKFLEMVNSEDFQRKLRSAQENPDSSDSRYVRCKLMPYLLVSGAQRSPFSAVKRRASIALMLAEVYYRGLPSLFPTVSPAGMDFPLTLRLASSVFGTQPMEVPDLATRTEMVRKDPAAAAEVFHVLVRTLVDVVFGLPLNRKNSQLSTTRGAFGRSVAFFGVIECQSRMALHIHGLLWAGVSPTLMQSVAHDAAICARIAAFIDSTVSSALPQEFHDMNGHHVPKYRGATVGFPTQWDEHVKHAFNCARSTNIHQPHSFSCWKGNRAHCRFAMPAPLKEATGPSTIVLLKDGGCRRCLE
eukprot:PhM_4_TR15175/c1_g1_i1/m.66982